MQEIIYIFRSTIVKTVLLIYVTKHLLVIFQNSAVQYKSFFMNFKVERNFGYRHVRKIHRKIEMLRI